MPVRGQYHQQVRTALEKDGWTITHDPLRLQLGQDSLYVDLGAEQVIAAERGIERIAVEIKSFTAASELTDLQEAIGQYLLYEWVLSTVQPDRTLYLAVPERAYLGVFGRDIGQVALSRGEVRLIVLDTAAEEVKLWTHRPTGE